MSKQKKQEKIDRQKRYFAYLIAFLFLGSTFAAALLYGGGSRITLPESPLLAKPLDENQVQLLIQNKGAYVVAEAPTEAQPVLIDMVNRYAPLLYLYGETTNQTAIQVTTAKGTKTFSELDFEVIEDYICEDYHPAIPECQTRQAIKDLG